MKWLQALSLALGPWWCSPCSMSNQAMKSLMTSANIQVLMEGTPGLDLGAIAKGQWLVLTCSLLGRILNKQSTVGFVLNKQSQANCALKLARLKKIQQVGNSWNITFVSPLIYFALRHTVIRWPNCGKLQNPNKTLVRSVFRKSCVQIFMHYTCRDYKKQL